MFNLNKYLPRKADQDRTLSRSESVVSASELNEQKDIKAAEGFLCPTCYAAFPNDVQLQNHYESSHSEGLQGSVTSGKVHTCPSCRMKLGSEIELNSHFYRHHATDKDQGEVESLRMQVQALMEGKALLQKEMENLRVQLVNEAKTSSKLGVEKKNVESKILDMNTELKNMKIRTSEDTKEKENLKYALKEAERKIKDLEVEIQQRPSTDDVSVLKAELVKVQKMMDQVTLQKEAEKEILHKRNSELEAMCEKLREEKLNLTKEISVCAKKEDLNQLKAKFQDAAKQNSELKTQIFQKVSEMEKMKEKMEKYEKTMVGLKRLLSRGSDSVINSEIGFDDIYGAISQLKSAVSEKNAQLENLTLELNECKKFAKYKEESTMLAAETSKWKRQSEILEEELKKVHLVLDEEKSRHKELKTIHEELLVKIEEGEGLNTAILQLKEENVKLKEMAAEKSASLSSDVAKLNQKYSDLKERHDEIVRKLNEKSEKVNQCEDECSALKSALNLQREEKEKLISVLEKERESHSEQKCQNSVLINRLAAMEREMEEIQGRVKSTLSFIGHILTKLELVLKEDQKVVEGDIESHLELSEELQPCYKKFKEIVEDIQKERVVHEDEVKMLEIKCESLREVIQKNAEDGALMEQKLINIAENSDSAIKSLKSEVEAQLKKISVLESEKESHLQMIDSFVKEQQEDKQRIEDLEQSENELLSAQLTWSREKSELEGKLDGLAIEVKTLEQRIEQLVKSHESQLSASALELEEKVKIISDMESTITQLKEHCDALRKENEKTSEDLNAARTVITEQNVNFRREIDAIQEDKNTKIHAMEEELSKLRKKIDEMQDVEKNLRLTLDSTLASLDAKKFELDRTISEYEAKVHILTESVNMMREDLQVEIENRIELEGKIDELGGNKLELEAKLENLYDERQALLDRCLRSESECEKLAVNNSELHARLEDVNAALHDLGRENQTLQMELEKHLGRKWADDAEVTCCSSCGRVFTVTVRKHHCRNCGKIFCHECSAKTAEVASSKKPVRVCDVCHKELTK